MVKRRLYELLGRAAWMAGKRYARGRLRLR
jgi:hypothetical protein